MATNQKVGGSNPSSRTKRTERFRCRRLNAYGINRFRAFYPLEFHKANDKCQQAILSVWRYLNPHNWVAKKGATFYTPKNCRKRMALTRWPSQKTLIGALFQSEKRRRFGQGILGGNAWFNWEGTSSGERHQSKAAKEVPKNLKTVENQGVSAYGGIAQLGERRVRNAEVEGSIPFESTMIS